MLFMAELFYSIYIPNCKQSILYKEKIMIWYLLCKQVLAAISVSLGSMVVGYSQGYTSPALVSMNATDSTLTVSTQEVSLINFVSIYIFITRQKLVCLWFVSTVV